MLETIEVAKLERLWQKRKRKIYMLYASLGISIFLIIAICAYFLTLPSNNKKTQNQNIVAVEKRVIPKTTPAMAENDIKEKVEKAKELQQLKEQVKELKAMQDLQALQALKDRERQNLRDSSYNQNANSAGNTNDEIDMNEYLAAPNVSKNTTYRIDEQQTQTANNRLVVRSTNNDTSTNKPRTEPRSSGNLKISSSEVKTGGSAQLGDMSFNNMTSVDRDPKEARRLANEYYLRKDYENAAKWAFELNDIDKSSPDGWIIFAKAKYNSGKKADAIKVLEIYKGQANDPAAIQALITKMQNNAIIE